MNAHLPILVLLILARSIAAGEAKVLILGIDGMRPDSMTAAAPLPAFDALKAQAAWNDDARTVFPTISGPCWSSILCGVNVHRHLVVDNKFQNHRLDRFPSLFHRLSSAKPGLRTASIVAWEPINQHIVGKAATVVKNHPATDAGDDAVADDAIALIREGTTDLVFLHCDAVDHAGHAKGYGPQSPEYLASIRRMDGRVGRIMKAIDERRGTQGEDWLVIAVTDHGGRGKGHGGNTPEETTVFLWIAGDAGVVKRGPLSETPDTLDIAPTVAAHLRIPVDPTWSWEGRARGLIHTP